MVHFSGTLQIILVSWPQRLGALSFYHCQKALFYFNQQGTYKEPLEITQLCQVGQKVHRC